MDKQEIGIQCDLLHVVGSPNKEHIDEMSVAQLIQHITHLKTNLKGILISKYHFKYSFVVYHVNSCNKINAESIQYLLLVYLHDSKMYTFLYFSDELQQSFIIYKEQLPSLLKHCLTAICQYQ